MKIFKKLVLPAIVLSISLFLGAKSEAWYSTEELQQEIVKTCNEDSLFTSCENADVFYAKYLIQLFLQNKWNSICKRRT